MKVLQSLPEMLLGTMVKETPAPGGSCFLSSLQNQDIQLQVFKTQKIVLRLHTSLEEVKMQRNLQSLDFQRLFRQEESSLSSKISLNMSETSLRFTKLSWLTSSLGESWWASKSELIEATMCENSSTLPSLELMKPWLCTKLDNYNRKIRIFVFI